MMAASPSASPKQKKKNKTLLELKKAVANQHLKRFQTGPGSACKIVIRLYFFVKELLNFYKNFLLTLVPYERFQIGGLSEESDKLSSPLVRTEWDERNNEIKRTIGEGDATIRLPALVGENWNHTKPTGAKKV